MEMTINNKNQLEQMVESPSSKKIAAVDTASNITYSLAVGSILDYLAGLDPTGIATSRAYATIINSATGAPYGWWREKVFGAYESGTNTAKDIGKTVLETAKKYTPETVQDVVRNIYNNAAEKVESVYDKIPDKAKEIAKKADERTVPDLIAFNTFQVPLYATAVAIGSLVSEGSVDWEKAKDGATYLAAISPFIGPTMGWTMDTARKLFGIKPAAEGAYKTKTGG